MTDIYQSISLEISETRTLGLVEVIKEIQVIEGNSCSDGRQKSDIMIPF